MKKIFYEIAKWFFIPLAFIWQLPQNILGLIVLLWFKVADKSTKLIHCRVYPDLDDNTGEELRNFFYDNLYIFTYWSKSMSGGITLGQFVFLSECSKNNKKTWWHEGGGHGKQSLCLGPFYLPVVGLPSIFHAAVHKCRNYYHFFTEKWADKKGDVNR